MTLAQEMTLLGQKAKEAARLLAKASPAAKNAALTRLAALLEEREAELRTANAQDLDAARARGLDAPRMDRLTLHPAVLADMRAACLHVAGLPDPVGAMDSQWQRPNGLLVGRMRVPLGVIAMIYEARPNVTIDAAILCLKAGNAVILRGGSEALHSNTALAALLRQALEEAGLPADAAQLVTTTDHAAVTELCKLDQYIDVMIPRGGEGLVRAVTEAATMPVLKHYKGVCHAFVDADADLDKALDVVFNGKVQRPGVCNALECLLVHKDCAAAFLPRVGRRLGEAGVEFRACPASLPLLVPDLFFAALLAAAFVGYRREGAWMQDDHLTLRRQKGFHLHCVCALHPDLCLTVQQSPWAVAAHRANLTLIFPGRLKQKVRSVALTELAFLQQAER